MKHFAEVDGFFKQRQEVGYSFLCSEELTVLTDTRAYVNNSIATPHTAAQPQTAAAAPAPWDGLSKTGVCIAVNFLNLLPE